MTGTDSTSGTPDEGQVQVGIRTRPVAREGGSGLLKQYKPEQGKTTRVGTFVGVGAMIAWGAYFLYDQLAVYEGDDAWRLLITNGIPLLFAVAIGAVAWWFIFGHRGIGDFMIATEGEMKKVSWSTKSEVIGSTKVVIMFTVMLALLLFVVDTVFKVVFTSIGVLKQ